MHGCQLITRILALLIVFAASSTVAQSYPSRPIRLLAPETGGGGDFVARIVAQGISGPLAESVIVDNRGLVGADIAVRAAPDGYTLLLYASPLWLAPFLRDKVSYEPLRDFAPITLASMQPNVLVLHPSVSANSVRELIALAKAKPKHLNYSSGSPGSPTHLAAELFKAMAGVDIVHIAYKGNGPALTAVLSGEVQVIFSNSVSVISPVKSGKLKALAVTSSRPFAPFPELPTIADSGIPGYQAETLIAIFAPARTPPAVISRLNQEIVQVLRRPAIKEKFLNSGVEAVGSTPQELTLSLKSDMARLGKVIQDAGIRAD